MGDNIPDSARTIFVLDTCCWVSMKTVSKGMNENTMGKIRAWESLPMAFPSCLQCLPLISENIGRLILLFRGD